MSLANLAQFAAAAATTQNVRIPMEDLSIEEARAVVKVRDGNKKPNEDGSQALVLGFGKLVLSLDVIAAGATRVNANKEQVADFSAQLSAAVNEGAFDTAIVAAQAKIRAQKAQPKAPKVAKTETTVSEPDTSTAEDTSVSEADIDGLDLGSL